MPEDNAEILLANVCRNSKDLVDALLDLHEYEQRLSAMSANGISHVIISQNPPGAQGIRDPSEAESYVIRSNNYLAALVSKAPARFSAFAAPSMHDPQLQSRR
jgi:2,3-dihydroxybenzoate decarboxylase